MLLSDSDRQFRIYFGKSEFLIMWFGSKLVWPLVVLVLFILLNVKAIDDEEDDDDEPSVGVRALFHQGTLPANHSCSTEEFETVKVAIQNHLGSSSSDRRRSLLIKRPVDRRASVNCAEICCPFAYMTCVVYHPRCVGYPTPSSNRECDRRRQRRNLPLLVPSYDIEECNEMKTAALGAVVASIDDGVSTECSDLVLAPTLLECFPISAYEEESATTADSGCSVTPNQYQQASKWYGSIYVGFDAPSAVVDFSSTTIDPSTVDKIWVDDHIFTSMVINGTKLTLTAKQTDRWFSRVNKSHIHFSSRDGTDKLESLHSTGLPTCRAVV